MAKAKAKRRAVLAKSASPPAKPASPPPEKPVPKRTEAGWDRERQRSAETQAAKSRAGRDIAGDCPQVVNAERKATAAQSFELFCRTYFGDVFNLPWSNDHRRAIDRIEAAVLQGGLFAYAFPRGSGKTSLAEAAVLWATLYGYRLFPVVIGSDESSALELLESVKMELEANDLLLEDFPEVCHPIRKLEGIAHRANGQTFNGERTHVVWTAKEIVLPTIPGSVASGAIIRVTGITGRIRGMKFKRPDGKSVRPDLVVVDDPQTDESAKSPTQSANRVRILSGAVLGLAGPGKKIAGVMPCTVIEPGDMADEILDRQRHPAWQGERTKLVYKWPENEALWEQYKKVRSDGLRAGDGGKAGTDFYRANREAMDRGSEVAWAVRHNPDELSAIQHAMNLRADLGDPAFFAEYQNDPIKSVVGESDALTADAIASKLNGRGRGEVPDACTKVVAFIDVQKPLLYWAVGAFEDDFSGYLLDYGVFPDQKRSYFAMREAKRTLSVVLRTKSLEESIYQGLSRLTSDIIPREWGRDDGANMQVERCLIDANWGESTDVIYQFARESPHASVLVPTHGKYVGAVSRPFNEYKRKRGDEIGDHWRRPSPQGRRAVRYGLFDANYWKSFLHARLAVPLGGRGCLSLFGSDPQEHKLLAEHLTAENPIRVEAKGNVVTEWKIKNTRPDNHWLDCLSGLCVAASMLRVSLAERRQEQPRARPVITFAEARKTRQHHGRH